MEKALLKSNLHDLIDKIENKNLLEEYYTEMKYILDRSKSDLWETLSDVEKDELLQSYEESESEKNLKDNDTVLKKYADWL